MQVIGGIAALGVAAKLGGWFGGVVGGMLLVFGGMWIWSALSLGAAERVAVWLAPAVRFLGRWMAVCFVPALVVIEGGVGGGVWWRLGLGASVGCVVTLLTTAAALSFLIRLKNARIDATTPAHAEGHQHHDPLAMSWGWIGVWGVVVGVAVGVWWVGFGEVWGGVVGGWLAGSVGAYGLAEQLRAFLSKIFRRYIGETARRWVVGVMHPLLVAAAGLWWVRTALLVDAKTYLTADVWGPGAGDLLMWGLGPGLASLGMLLFERRRMVQERGLMLLGVLGASAMASVFVAAALAHVLGMRGVEGLSLLPRSVTSPIAIPMAERLGASVGLTVAGVMVSGVVGAVVGRPLLNALGMRGALVEGVAIGACAHGLGTVSLLEESPEAAAYAGVSFALLGAFSALLVEIPVVRAWLIVWVG